MERHRLQNDLLYGIFCRVGVWDIKSCSMTRVLTERTHRRLKTTILLRFLVAISIGLQTVLSALHLHYIYTV